MNLVSATLKASLEKGIDNLHDTWGREITATRKVKTPKSTGVDADSYDFINDKSPGEAEFSYSYVETPVVARIKFLDKQEIESEFSPTQSAAGDTELTFSQKLGVIRIKVKAADQAIIDEAHSYTVDGFHCVLAYRDRPHGVIESKYVTYYLLRVS